MLGWISNLFVIAAIIRTGKYTRDAFVLGAIGEGLWLVEAIRIGEWSLAAMCVLLCGIYVVNVIRYKA